ncbi:substrate-binding periplasmic protein [Chitinimonas koreensis]|uniref:substrate-binding periplasmic protein n=1 Tax=Chitinimonas koreensis TaxID=356302 RepID=UPI0004133C4D|nr:transporter substrate-binding domain-containing protein [Chitinimonas koreensis]QNM94696.1 transporter substrate-binding domain-containing protein [Chitinimonas koreensis]
MKILIWACTLALLLPAQAAKLTLCGVEWGPFSVPEGDQLVRGISVEIQREAFRRLGIIDLEFRKAPWLRCKTGVQHGSYDAVLDAIPDRDMVAGAVPSAYFPVAVYVRQDCPHDTFSWNAMRGKTVGVVHGYHYPGNIDRFDGWSRDESVDDEQAMVKLKAGRYHHLLSDIFTAPAMSEKVGVPIKMLKPMLGAHGLFLVFGKRNQALADRHAAVLADMIEDGSMDRIYRRYLPYGYTDLQRQLAGLR